MEPVPCERAPAFTMEHMTDITDDRIAGAINNLLVARQGIDGCTYFVARLGESSGPWYIVAWSEDDRAVIWLDPDALRKAYSQSVASQDDYEILNQEILRQVRNARATLVPVAIETAF
jgi:hypothetical protein